MTKHADLTEGSDQRIVADRALGEWADRLLEQAGLGVTIVDRSFVERLAEVAQLARRTLAHGRTTATDPRADGAGQ
jgi:hypothetical protein